MMSGDTQPPRKRALNQAEAAEYLGISVAVLRQATRSGQIPAVQIGRMWRYDPDALADLLRGRAKPTDPDT